MRSILLYVCALLSACNAGAPDGDASAPGFRVFDQGVAPQSTSDGATTGESGGSGTSGDSPETWTKRCSKGRCVEEGTGSLCSADEHCRAGCWNGRCMPGGGGRPCGSDKECNITRCDGDRCVRGGPGRLCSAHEGSTDCSEKRCLGTRCVAGGIGDACTADGDCNTKKTCRGTFCEPGVWSHNNCGDDGQCEPGFNKTGDGKKQYCHTDGTCKPGGEGLVECDAVDDCAYRRCDGEKCRLGGSLDKPPCNADAGCQIKTCHSLGSCMLGGWSTATCTADKHCEFKRCDYSTIFPGPDGPTGICEVVAGPGKSVCSTDDNCFVVYYPPSSLPLDPDETVVQPEAPAQPHTPAASRARLADALRLRHPTLGSLDAPHEIVVFQDLRCGMCKRAFQELLPHLRERWVETGRARVVFVELPLGMAEEERRLANGVLCADREGRYLELVERLYAGMKTLSSKDLVALGEDLGLASTGFAACVAEDRFRAQIEADAALGGELGVDGTPTFYVDGHMLLGAMDPEVFDLHMTRLGLDTEPVRKRTAKSLARLE